MNSKKIILFASGSGSNFKKICEYFKNDNTVSIELLISNNPKAKALQIAESFNIKTLVIDKKIVMLLYPPNPFCLILVRIFYEKVYDS